MLKQKYFLADIFILSAEKQPIKLSWRKIVWLPDNTVACGNPLRFICTYDEYINKNRENMKTAYISNVLFSEKTTLDKEIQCQELLNGGGMIYNC